jgi:hypothetical protein
MGLNRFKALADPTRRHILKLLRERDMSAGEIAERFSMSKPGISHHLADYRFDRLGPGRLLVLDFSEMTRRLSRIREQNASIHAPFRSIPRLIAFFSRFRRISMAGAQEYKACV